VAIEQGYATAQWITREGAGKGLGASRLAVAGDSVGGNMTAAWRSWPWTVSMISVLSMPWR
jgi:acetyl esterase/lipase